MNLIYLIFKRGKFFAFTDDKKVLKKFIKQRGDKFTIEKVDKNELEKIINNNGFYMKKLSYYEHYDLVLTEEELAYAHEVGEDRLTELIGIVHKLRQLLKFVKMEKSEIFEIEKFFEFVDMIDDDLNSDESCVFLEDYFDIKSILLILIGKHNNTLI